MARRRPNLPELHWRRKNHFRLLANGDQFFPEMLGAIASARRQILLELYLFESGRVADRFVSALGAAASRGVDVRVIIDAFGSLALSSPDRETLSRAGVKLHVYNPLQVLGDRVRNLARDHRKLLVIDGKRAFVGGTGITDEFSPEASPDSYWRETMLDIRGPVVGDWARLFAQVWTGGGNPAFRVASAREAVAGGTQAGRVAIAHGLNVQDVQHHALDAIRVARRRVWLSTPYFLPSMRMRRELARAARRGVEVRLILPGSHTDHPLLRMASHHYYAGLLRHGIHIHEYQPRFIHSKTLLVDDWCSIGSCNFDRWNLRWNLEANQEVQDAVFAREVAAMLEKDILCSVRIEPEDWAGRLPVISRLEEGLANGGQAIERFLDRL
ncbi:MAG: phospholipase D-like domain-containing protein [Gammaproteobacteria bacterium]